MSDNDHRVTVIVPSRGRPAAAWELVENFYATATWSTHRPSRSRLVLGLDLDDPTVMDYPLNDCEVLFSPTRRSLAWWTNQIAIREAWNGVFAVASIGDDHRLSEGWETLVLDTLSMQGTGICYGDDGFQGENRATAVFMTTDIVRALGYMCVPGCEHMEIDVAWTEWGRAAECLVYLPDLKTPHLHPLAGKADWDDSYRESNSEATYARDRAAYRAYRESGQFDRDVALIRSLQGRAVPVPPLPSD